MAQKSIEELKADNARMKRKIAQMCDLCAVPIIYRDGSEKLGVPAHGVARCDDVTCPLFEDRPPKYQLD